jgi:hypothetical protein
VNIRGKRRGAPVIFVLVVLAVVAGALAATPAQAATTPNAHGVVTAADGSGPIAGIKVCATHRSTSGGYGGQRCTETAADGSYTIPLYAGLFSFRAEQEYLYGTWLPQDYNSRTAYSFSVTTSRTINFAMVRGAKISGYLHAPDGGNPADDFLAVEAYPVDSEGHTGAYMNLFSNVTSNGYFEVSKIPPGQYKLLASDNNDPVKYAQQWYPDAPAASGGTTITVTVGQHVTGRDLTLTEPGGITITLRKPTGSLAKGDLIVYDEDGRRVYDGSGEFQATRTISGLHPGVYKVRASPYDIPGYREWYSHKGTFATANVIPVASGQTTVRTLTFHYGTLKATSRPKLTFHTYELTASKGTWTPRPSSYRYDWLRDGKIVQSASAAWWYNPTRADVGHRIKVCVRASRSGYAPGRSCSDYSRTIKTY